MTENHPREYTVHGVSAEMLRGNEDTIYCPAWFVEIGGSYFWTWETDWTQENLRQVRNGEEEFIYFLPESERVPLHAGELVYLAGRDFMVKILSFLAVGEIKLSVRHWKQISNGYYIATMTPAAFSIYAEHLSMSLWNIVERFLIDASAETREMAADAFDAYTAIAYYSGDDKKEQSLRRAMFYTTVGDSHRKKLEARMAVEFEKSFDTTALFHAAVQQRLDALQQ